jgi:uncharacterized protein YaeQ
MKPKLMMLAFAVCATAAAAGTQTITGVITDTMCGAKHSMMKGQPDDQCVRVCVKGAHEYALYDGKRIWKLSDQKTPARFAAARVTVTGSMEEKTMTIKVAAIRASE